jgi:hypothetical protein
MQGHIYRRKKPDGTWSRWHALIDLPTDRTGNRPQKTSTHDTERDAQAWLATITQELRAGEGYDTKLTVAGFLIGWLEGRQSLRPSTRQAYQAHLTQHLIPELGHHVQGLAPGVQVSYTFPRYPASPSRVLRRAAQGQRPSADPHSGHRTVRPPSTTSCCPVT